MPSGIYPANARLIQCWILVDAILLNSLKRKKKRKMTPKAWSIKEEILKILALQKTLKAWKDKLQIERIYLQIIFPTENFYPEYIKNFEYKI